MPVVSNPVTYLLQVENFSEIVSLLPDFSEIERQFDNFILKETLFSVIKTVGGVVIAIYVGDHSTNRIVPIVYSMVAVEGAWQYFRIFYRVFRNKMQWSQFDDGFLTYDATTGAMIYFGSLYVFSEGWKCGNKRFIYFLGTAAAGLYLAAESIYKLKWNSKENILLRSCQLASVPALIVCGATYLWYFRNINEEWIKWLTLILNFKTGFLFAAIGTLRNENPRKPIRLLVRVIELLTGGCILAVSSTILAIYFSMKKFHSFWSYLMSVTGFIGVFVVLGSISCFQRYVGMDEDVSSCVGCIITGVVMVFTSGLMVKCMRGNLLVYLLFPILTGSGQYLFWQSVFDLYRILPGPVFIRYCQRTLGPLFTICSSLASGYVTYRMGWNYSQMMLPLPLAGIYVTYKGFSRPSPVPRPETVKYYQRTLGSLITVCSTAASAYVAYHMGWRYSLMMLPLPCAGIYVAYKGFRRG